MLRIAAALGAWSALGCLPAGEPPPGKQIVRDRTVSYAFFASSGSDAEPNRLFCTGPDRLVRHGSSGSELPVTDLYALPDTKEAPVSLSNLQPVVKDVEPLGFGVVGASPATDRSGRMFVFTAPSQTSLSTGLFETTRYDPRTGERQVIVASRPLFSSSRERVFAFDAFAGTLFEQERSVAFADVGQPVFIGEDLYFVAGSPPRSQRPGTAPTSSPTSWTLTRVKPNAAPEALVVSSSLLHVAAIESDLGPHLLVNRGVAAGPTPALFMLNVDTLTTVQLPSDLARSSFISASSSGHWLLFLASIYPTTSPTQEPLQTLTLLEWTTGARMDLDPRKDGITSQALWNGLEWRPLHEELWMQAENAVVKITEPGDIITRMDMTPGRGLTRLPQAGTDRFSFFTADGMHWFSGSGYEGPVYVGRVDDPTSPLLQMTPDGSQRGPYWDLGDRRLLTTAWGDQDTRQDFYLVELEAGTSRPVAGGGRVVAVGKTRVLAGLDWDGARDTGALTLVDLATGSKTLLADDVYKVALDADPFLGRSVTSSAGADTLAPGTRVAFLSRGRLPSPYDGLWVTELP